MAVLGARKRSDSAAPGCDTVGVTDDVSKSAAASPEPRWYLESLAGGPRGGWQVPIQSSVFRVGRGPRLELTLNSDSVSKHHAEIYSDGDSLWLRDLGSTNGSFVNGERVKQVALCEDDILSFTTLEFRLGRYDSLAMAASATVPLAHMEPPAQQAEEDARRLRRLIHRRAVDVLFQPILVLAGRSVFGHEALGRGRHPGLPELPDELFRVAARLGVEAELSRLFRAKLPECLGQRRDLGTVFLNTHPAELEQPDLISSLEALRRLLPDIALTLEVHERAIAELTMISQLKARLADLGVRIAYDDFGAGQSRLLELAELPPDFLKFDTRFVHGIDRAPSSRRRLLASLVSATHDLGVKTIAEGVETAAEVEICREVGFDLAQGFFFRRPMPAERL